MERKRKFGIENESISSLMMGQRSNSVMDVKYEPVNFLLSVSPSEKMVDHKR